MLKQLETIAGHVHDLVEEQNIRSESIKVTIGFHTEGEYLDFTRMLRYELFTNRDFALAYGSIGIRSDNQYYIQGIEFKFEVR